VGVFGCDVLGEVPLQEMVIVKVREEEEVMWVEKEDVMALD
jgi:hypothetical protein